MKNQNQIAEMAKIIAKADDTCRAQTISEALYDADYRKCECLNDVERYNIYYTKYNIIANDYIPYIKVVETNDIYHEVGKMICTSFEKIDSIRYSKPKASQEDCEKLWLESGYEKITDTLWRKDRREEQ